jgi:hypothetical protein
VRLHTRGSTVRGVIIPHPPTKATTAKIGAAITLALLAIASWLVLFSGTTPSITKKIDPLPVPKNAAAAISIARSSVTVLDTRVALTTILPSTHAPLTQFILNRAILATPDTTGMVGFVVKGRAYLQGQVTLAHQTATVCVTFTKNSVVKTGAVVLPCADMKKAVNSP